MNKNKKGFTLVELIGVIIIVLIISLMSIFAVNRITRKSKMRAIIKVANTYVKGAMTKQTSDRDNGLQNGDIFHNTIYGKVCYSITDKTLEQYVDKGKGNYRGSVEICYGDDCSYSSKVWITDGRYYIDGVTDPSDETKLVKSFSSDYPESCGVKAIGGGSSGDLLTSNFDYTGGEQEFITIVPGVYSLEVWGAQGGDYSVVNIGGYGSYSYVEVELKQGEKLYINVGGKGSGNCPVDNNTCKGSYNGGAKGGLYIAAGGGATHIATASGLLRKVPENKVYVVAGGGSGGDSSYQGSHAGGYTVEQTISSKGYWGDMRGKFGYYGGYSDDINNQRGNGGGYSSKSCDDFTYSETNSKWWNFPVGGTGYVFNPRTKNGIMYCYSCPQQYARNDYGDRNDIAFGTSRTEVNAEFSDTPKPKVSKIGNGYARITYIGTFTE